MATKRIPIYFYYVNVMPIGDGVSDTGFDWNTFLNDFRQMLRDLANVNWRDAKKPSREMKESFGWIVVLN